MESFKQIFSKFIQRASNRCYINLPIDASEIPSEALLNQFDINGEAQDVTRHHITLAIIENISDDDVFRIVERVSMPIRFEAEAARVGTFEEAPSKPFMLVVNADPPLIRIQNQIKQAAEAIGVEISIDHFHEKKWNPHITLALDCQDLPDEFDSIAPVRFTVDRVAFTRDDYKEIVTARLPKVAGDRLLVTSGLFNGAGIAVTKDQLAQLIQGKSILYGATKRVLTIDDGPFVVRHGIHIGHEGVPGQQGGTQPGYTHVPGSVEGGWRMMDVSEGEIGFRRNIEYTTSYAGQSPEHNELQIDFRIKPDPENPEGFRYGQFVLEMGFRKRQPGVGVTVSNRSYKFDSSTDIDALLEQCVLVGNHVAEAAEHDSHARTQGWDYLRFHVLGFRNTGHVGLMPGLSILDSARFMRHNFIPQRHEEGTNLDGSRWESWSLQTYQMGQLESRLKDHEITAYYDEAGLRSLWTTQRGFSTYQGQVTQDAESLNSLAVNLNHVDRLMRDTMYEGISNYFIMPGYDKNSFTVNYLDPNGEFYNSARVRLEGDGSALVDIQRSEHGHEGAFQTEFLQEVARRSDYVSEMAMPDFYSASVLATQIITPEDDRGSLSYVQLYLADHDDPRAQTALDIVDEAVNGAISAAYDVSAFERQDEPESETREPSDGPEPDLSREPDLSPEQILERTLRDPIHFDDEPDPEHIAQFMASMENGEWTGDAGGIARSVYLAINRYIDRQPDTEDIAIRHMLLGRTEGIEEAIAQSAIDRVRDMSIMDMPEYIGINEDEYVAMGDKDIMDRVYLKELKAWIDTEFYATGRPASSEELDEYLAPVERELERRMVHVPFEAASDPENLPPEYTEPYILQHARDIAMRVIEQHEDPAGYDMEHLIAVAREAGALPTDGEEAHWVNEGLWERENQRLIMGYNDSDEVVTVGLIEYISEEAVDYKIDRARALRALENAGYSEEDIQTPFIYLNYFASKNGGNGHGTQLMTRLMDMAVEEGAGVAGQPLHSARSFYDQLGAVMLGDSAFAPAKNIESVAEFMRILRAQREAEESGDVEKSTVSRAFEFGRANLLAMIKAESDMDGALSRITDADHRLMKLKRLAEHMEELAKFVPFPSDAMVGRAMDTPQAKQAAGVAAPEGKPQGKKSEIENWDLGAMNRIAGQLKGLSQKIAAYQSAVLGVSVIETPLSMAASLAEKLVAKLGDEVRDHASLEFDLRSMRNSIFAEYWKMRKKMEEEGIFAHIRGELADIMEEWGALARDYDYSKESWLKVSPGETLSERHFNPQSPALRIALEDYLSVGTDDQERAVIENMLVVNDVIREPIFYEGFIAQEYLMGVEQSGLVISAPLGLAGQLDFSGMPRHMVDAIKEKYLERVQNPITIEHAEALQYGAGDLENARFVTTVFGADLFEDTTFIQLLGEDEMPDWINSPKSVIDAAIRGWDQIGGAESAMFINAIADLFEGERIDADRAIDQESKPKNMMMEDLSKVETQAAQMKEVMSDEANANEMKNLVEQIYEHTQTHIMGEGLDPNQTVRLYRAMRASDLPTGANRIRLNAASSWSLSPIVAWEYAQIGNLQTSVIVQADVPMSRIFAIPGTGPCLRSSEEVIVLGQDGIDVMVVSADQYDIENVMDLEVRALFDQRMGADEGSKFIDDKDPNWIGAVYKKFGLGRLAVEGVASVSPDAQQGQQGFGGQQQDPGEQQGDLMGKMDMLKAYRAATAGKYAKMNVEKLGPRQRYEAREQFVRRARAKRSLLPKIKYQDKKVGYPDYFKGQERVGYSAYGSTVFTPYLKGHYNKWQGSGKAVAEHAYSSVVSGIKEGKKVRGMALSHDGSFVGIAALDYDPEDAPEKGKYVGVSSMAFSEPGHTQHALKKIVSEAAKHGKGIYMRTAEGNAEMLRGFGMKEENGVFFYDPARVKEIADEMSDWESEARMGRPMNKPVLRPKFDSMYEEAEVETDEPWERSGDKPWDQRFRWESFNWDAYADEEISWDPERQMGEYVGSQMQGVFPEPVDEDMEKGKLEILGKLKKHGRGSMSWGMLSNAVADLFGGQRANLNDMVRDAQYYEDEYGEDTVWPDGKIQPHRTEHFERLADFAREAEGVRDSDLTGEWSDAAEYIYNRTQSVFERAGFDKEDTVRLYRGVRSGAKRQESGWAQVQMGSLSPWTFSKKVAAEMAASDGNGYLVKADVPVRRIFSMWATGPGDRKAMEYLVLGQNGIKAFVTPVRRKDS